MSEGETASEVTHPSYGDSPFYSIQWYNDRGEIPNFDLSRDGHSGIYLTDEDDRAFGTTVGLYDNACEYQNDWNVNWRSSKASFDRCVNSIRNDPHDPRWGCPSWVEHVAFVVGALWTSYARDFSLDDAPVTILRRYDSKRAYVAWRSTAGGGAVFCADFGSHEFTCLSCAACSRHDRFHIESTLHQPERTPARYVYFVQCAGGGPIKIGHSTSPDGRLSQMQTGSPYVLRVVATMRGGIEVERTLHRAFAKDRLHGEWFNPSRELMAFIDEISRKGSAQ